ncbi:hypothetical protein HY638_02385 [Candidatus Woesearchaeota archaeon]|nr:hypothetical protein [Candidatus Woesearchaeota archaeon]
MDFIAHGFWSYIIFHRTKKALYAVFFGLLPDIVSWGPYFFYRLFTGASFGKPDISQIPSWTYTLYGIGHSLIVWLAIIGIVYLILRRVPVYLYAAPLEVLMDIPTHSQEFLPTPFLWPVSDWAFPGISWGQWWFMVLNYSLIAIFMVYILNEKRTEKIKNK